MLKYCEQNDIDFNYLISIDGGYYQSAFSYFIVTFSSIFDKKNNTDTVGMSQELLITRAMFDYVKPRRSLNKVTEEIAQVKDNKKSQGISGYLTNGYYYRSYFDLSSVISAFRAIFNSEKQTVLEKKYYKKIYKLPKYEEKTWI